MSKQPSWQKSIANAENLDQKRSKIIPEEITPSLGQKTRSKTSSDPKHPKIGASKPKP